MVGSNNEEYGFKVQGSDLNKNKNTATCQKRKFYWFEKKQKFYN